jgi:hypothetical protein
MMSDGEPRLDLSEACSLMEELSLELAVPCGSRPDDP